MPIVGSVFGATPSAVIKHGGCCAGLSRLCIVSLATQGIPSRQITLYHRTGKAQHCLVEAFLRDESLIVDPTYGLYYTRADGGGIGLASLQGGVIPIFRKCSSDELTAYPSYPYYDFDFAATKTANWTKSRIRRLAYRFLRGVTNGAVDRLRPPPWVEWPQLLLVALLSAVAIVAQVGGMLMREMTTIGNFLLELLLVRPQV